MRLQRKHGVLGFAAVVVAATLWYLLHFTPIVPHQVADAFTKNLLREHGLRLEIARVRGNPLGELEVEGVRLRRDAPGGAEIGRLRAVELRVDVWQLLRGRVAVHRLRLVEPEFRLQRQDLAWSRTRPRASQAPSPPLHLGALEITGGSVEVALDSARTLRVDSLECRIRLEMRGGAGQLHVERLAARLPGEDLAVRELSADVDIASERVQVDAGRLQTGRSQLDFSLTVRPRQRWLRAQGQASPFQLEDLAGFVALPVQGRVVGPFDLTWSPDEVSFEGTWSGEYAAHAVTDAHVALAWTPQRFTLRQARGQLDDSEFELGLVQEGAALHGEVDLRHFDLRDWDAKLPPSRLHGRASFARRSAADTLQVRAELRPSDLAGCAVTRAHGRIGVIGQNATCRGVHIETATATVEGAGWVRDRDVGFDWQLDATDVASIMTPLGLRDLHGTAQVQGQFRGSLDSLACVAAGDFGSMRLGPLAARNGTLELEATRLLPVPALEVDVRAQSLWLQGRRLGEASALLAFDGTELELQRVQVSAADTMLALAATIRPLPRDWNGDAAATQLVSLHTALLQIGGQEFRVEEPASLWWRARAARLDSLRLVTRSGRARLDGVLDLDAKRVDGRTEIDEFDLGFLARLVELHRDLAGIGSGWIELHGPLDATQIDSRLFVRSARWKTLEVDSIRVDVQSDAFGTALRGSSIHTPFGSLHANGRIAALPAIRRAAGAVTSFQRAELEGELEVDDLALEPFWRGVRSIGMPADWDARLTTRLALGGSLADPRIGATGTARQVHFGRGIDVDSLRFEARYAAGTLEVPQLRIEAAGARLEVEGKLPITVQLHHGVDLRRDEAVDADLVLEQSSFAVVPRFVPLFELAPAGIAPGTVAATLHLGGTLNQPKLRGTLQVQGAGFTLANMEEVYYDVNANGTFVEDTLELGEIRGRSGPEGWVRGSGWVRFAGLAVSDFALAFDADRVPIYSLPEMAAVAGGHIDVRAVHLSAAAKPIPEFTGNLKVHEAEITREFTASAGESADLLEPTDRPDWLADVGIEAPGRVWVRNSNADAELGGSVQLVRTTAGLDLSGRATVKRGHYSAYLEKFEITRGELDWSRNPGWEPDLDIEARRGRVNERIYVQLTGTPSAPQLVFTSDSRGTSAELQQMLMADIRNDPSNVATTVVENVFTDLGYLDSITIDPASSRTPVAEGQQAPLISAYNVSAGWAVSDRVFVTYTRGLNQSDLNQRVAVELDVVRGLLLASSWEIRYVPSPEYLSDAAQNAFNVDLKFRREY